MNPHIILRSIKNFIRAYDDDLVDGLESSGTLKEIRQISTSRSTRMEQRIFIGVVFSDGSESYDATQVGQSIRYENVVTQTADNSYSIEVHIGDYAIQQDGEGPASEYELFETDTETFWTFVSRLARLFREYASIPSSTGSFVIEVYGDGSTEDRRIGVRDLSQTTVDAQGQERAVLYAILDFRVGTCGEPNPLA